MWRVRACVCVLLSFSHGCAPACVSRIIEFVQTAIVHHSIFQKHDTGAGHPETAARYANVMRALRGDTELWSRLIEIEAKPAARGDVQACHTPQHFKRVERAVSEGV